MTDSINCRHSHGFFLAWKGNNKFVHACISVMVRCRQTFGYIMYTEYFQNSKCTAKESLAQENPVKALQHFTSS